MPSASIRQSCRDGDDPCFDGRLGDGFTVELQSLDVEGDGVADALLGLLARLPGGHAAGQVGDVGRPVPLAAFVEDRVLSHDSSPSWAWRQMLSRVFGWTSSPGCPL